MKNGFMLGVNYWESNAGTKMWRDFDALIIEQDFKALSDNGVDTIRLFPLWTDFQPISAIHVCGGVFQEVVYKEELPLPFTKAGQNGVDEEMCSKMDIVLDLASKYNIDIIIGLLTGWMSGRMFTPPAFEGRKLVTDPFAVKWEIKYVSFLVERFKYHEAIISWDLGNECNCLQFDITADESYLWCANISGAIKRMDSSRPVISGLNCIHGKNSNTSFSPKILGDTTDILCTHPYPFFYDKCLNGNSISFRSLMHSSFDTALHADLSGKPAFVEEIGTLGPMYCDDASAGVFARINMYETLSQGFPGFLWWCGFDFEHLQFPPYGWFMWENELGVMVNNTTPKPVITEMKDFAVFINANKLRDLPEATKQAVCILSKEQSIWLVGYGAYMIARQAGFNVKFCYANDEIPRADLYMLPSITGGEPIYKNCIQEVLTRVKNDGANLYISIDKKAFLTNFEAITGAKIRNVRERNITYDFIMDNADFSLNFDYLYETESSTAKILIKAKIDIPVADRISSQTKKTLLKADNISNPAENLSEPLQKTPITTYIKYLPKENTNKATSELRLSSEFVESTKLPELPEYIINLMYENPYGKGKIYTLLLPLERLACESADFISDESAMPLFEIYNLFRPKTIACKTSKNVAINEQAIGDKILVTAINAGAPCEENIEVDSEYDVVEIIKAPDRCKQTENSISCHLDQGDVCMFYITKKQLK